MLREQIQDVLAALRGRGVVCEVIGSFARASALIDAESDLDILVESKGGLSEADVWDVAWTHLRDVDADLVFAEQLPEKKVMLMREHARA